LTTLLLLPMKKNIIYLSIIFIFLGCQKKDTVDVKLDPRYETPQRLIQTYWQALYEQRYKDAMMCFTDFREEEFDIKELIPMAEMDSLWIDSIVFLKTETDRAEIHYLVSYIFKDEKQPRTIFTGDKLRLTKDGWKIYDVLIPKQ
jgi:hypothetical protein